MTELNQTGVKKTNVPLCVSHMMLTLALLLTLSVNPVSGDYTFSCWKNGWRKNANDRSADLFAIETNHYGFTLDIADFDQVTLGRLNNPASYEQALKHRAKKLEKLPLAKLLIEIRVDGKLYRAKTCEAGKRDDVKRLSSVRLWESGRFVQHYDFLKLDFRDSKGKQLDCEARLDLVAWPGSLTFNLHVAADLNCEQSALRLSLKSELGNWSQEANVKGSWNARQEKSVSMTCPVTSAKKVPTSTLTVKTTKGQPIPVRFDKSKNCQVATARRLKRTWKTGYTDIRHYDDFKISVTRSDSREAVPFLLELRPPANVTGVCPILCDESGQPTGIPLQLSKNWHYKPTGSYVMAYAMLPTGKTANYLLRFVYGFYGTLPSASHAQLSLIGYGGNGRWDQLAIGCWGESICFDMDMSLVDVAITDIRLLMGRSGIRGRKWSWTNAGWGGDWLNMQDEHQKKYFPNSLKTAYVSHGPCLTDVRHQGCYGTNREVDFSASIQTLRTDDYCRTFQKLRYVFTRNVSAKRIWLFKLGRTHNYQTPRLAWGNLEGLIEERDVPRTLKRNQRLLNNVELTGTGPHWVAFPGASEADAKRPKPNGYRALIIRQYKVTVGEKTYSTPAISTPVHRANPTNLDLELLPPAGIRKFRMGDRVELDLELITLPRVADDYYGPNKAFRKHLTENPNSWKTTWREAKGNNLSVTISGGKQIQNYPLVIQAEKPEVVVKIKGGVGAVPVRIEGLAPNRGYHLYQMVNGKRIRFDQSVHGNDFWQTDFDPVSNTYSMTFNLSLDELDTSEWILTK